MPHFNRSPVLRHNCMRARQNERVERKLLHLYCFLEEKTLF